MNNNDLKNVSLINKANNMGNNENSLEWLARINYETIKKYEKGEISMGTCIHLNEKSFKKANEMREEEMNISFRNGCIQGEMDYRDKIFLEDTKKCQSETKELTLEHTKNCKNEIKQLTLVEALCLVRVGWGTQEEKQLLQKADSLISKEAQRLRLEYQKELIEEKLKNINTSSSNPIAPLWVVQKDNNI